MKKRIRRASHGFTLLEILVVIVIIGILSTIGLRTFASSQLKGRDSRRKSDLHNISSALEAYYNDKGQYPAAGNGLILGCESNAAEACTWGEIWQEDFNTTGVQNTVYMVELPADPSVGLEYFYVSAVPNKSYRLYARLENVQDGTINAVGSGYQCGTAECNYVVASSNESI